MNFTLDHLRILLQKCYSPETPNTERTGIEKQLFSFIYQPGSWKTFLELLQSSGDQIIESFCLLSLEKVIWRNWGMFNAEERNMIKNTLYKLLLDKNTIANTLKIKQISKLLIIVGKCEFPQTLPDFFDFIFKVLNDVNNFHIGLELFDSLLDEFFATSSFVLANLKPNLKSFMMQNLQNFNNIMFMHLSRSSKSCFFGSAHQRSNSFGSVSEMSSNPCLSIPNNATNRPLSPCFNSMLPSSSKRGSSKDLLDLSFDIYVCGLIMEILSKTIKYLPSESTVNPEILHVIMKIASVPLSSSSLPPHKLKLCTSAVNIFCDIITFLSAFSSSSYLLSPILDWSVSFLSYTNLDLLVYEEYIKKSVDFFVFLLPVFHQKYCYSSTFDSLKYMMSYLQFTLNQTSLENMSICVKAVTQFITELNEFDPRKNSHHLIKELQKELYNILLQFSFSIINKTIQKDQQTISATGLEKDSDAKTLTNNIGTFIVGLPEEFDTFLHVTFNSSFKSFAQILEAIYYQSKNEGITIYLSRLAIIDKNAIRSTFETNSTLSFYMSLILNKRLFNGGRFDIGTIVKELLQCFEIVEFIYQNYEISIQNIFLMTNLNSLVIRLLNIISIGILWVVKLCQPSEYEKQALTNMYGSPEAFVNFYITRSVNLLTNIISKDKSIKITALSASCLVHICQKFTITQLIACWDIFNFFHNLSSVKFSESNKKAISLLYQGACHLLLNKGIHVVLKTNNDDLGSNIYILFINLFTTFEDSSRVLSIQLQSGTCDKNEFIKYKIISKILAELITSLYTFSVHNKKSALEAFKKTFVIALNNIESLSINSNLLSYTFDLCIASMNSFREVFTEGTNMILNSLGNYMSNRGIQNNSKISVHFQEKLINTLGCVIESNLSPTQMGVFNNLIQSMYSFIQKENSPAVLEMCRLINSLVFKKCEYFYKNPDHNVGVLLQKYLDILFGNFIPENIELVKEFLEQMILNNDRCNLLLRPIFNESRMLTNLSMILFKMLAHTSFNSVHEEILLLLYQIGKINWDQFYKELLPFMLSQIPTLTNQNRAEIYKITQNNQDQPSFEANMKDIANDTRIYSYLNENPQTT